MIEFLFVKASPLQFPEVYSVEALDVDQAAMRLARHLRLTDPFADYTTGLDAILLLQREHTHFVRATRLGPREANSV